MGRISPKEKELEDNMSVCLDQISRFCFGVFCQDMVVHFYLIGNFAICNICQILMDTIE